ncbi:6-O-methylguanine DNA methyltransferase [Zobellella denitrificans]|uniref:6-O-methylguanine DNA methyltransferase n=1 Tax=Zobellella denitrificans TaxID=347534 RepID=A0A291HSW1_9GAMM|nr:bifunctional DNA-binding transcriptional regulator/O6-methylguanine-DNA methyltransferase Ada [Zobellella denitrificans]ATG75199.1 6-O-methylguanine DNA methyltransferase [Zobellella denitrificans]
MSRRHAENAAHIIQDPRWAQVEARDPAADGRFCYGVITTGVYCRPSCPSRRARPEHIRFYDSAMAAEAAGFRPCRRCRPEQPDPGGRQALITALCRHIEQADHSPTLAELSARVGLSPGHLQRLFKAGTGLSPRAYAQACRAERVRRALARERSVTEAIFEAGYGAGSRFYEEADQLLGMPPGRYRAGGAGTEIRFAVGQCSLGAILVAMSDKGICAILLGDDAEALLRELQERFPAARLIGGETGFEQWVARVVGLVECPRQGQDLPLDIRGTVFQQKVWQALRQIPAGATISYAELARRIGQPRAVRAVAGACAANALAVAIPCHRVVRTDGGLSGYRWGIARKRQLLAREAEPAEEG